MTFLVEAKERFAICLVSVQSVHTAIGVVVVGRGTCR